MTKQIWRALEAESELIAEAWRPVIASPVVADLLLDASVHWEESVDAQILGEKSRAHDHMEAFSTACDRLTDACIELSPALAKVYGDEFGLRNLLFLHAVRVVAIRGGYPQLGLAAGLWILKVGVLAPTATAFKDLYAALGKKPRAGHPFGMSALGETRSEVEDHIRAAALGVPEEYPLTQTEVGEQAGSLTTMKTALKVWSIDFEALMREVSPARARMPRRRKGTKRGM